MLKLHLKLPRRYFHMNVDFAVPKGSIYCLYGPSAAGKSSILSVLSGFETGYDEVKIEWDGSVLLESGPGSDKARFTPAWKRGIGYLTQSVPLFPHLSVRDNIRFGMNPSRFSKEQAAEMEEWYEEIVDRLELEPYLSMRPKQLSGGLTQRAALARALVPRPHLMLLDEPFSALDWQSRNHMQEVVLDFQRRLQMTIILVTHQLEEAQKMAGIIGVIHDGQILQEDSPDALMTRPQNWNVAKLLGYQHLWKDGGKYYALHPDRGVVVHDEQDSKYADFNSFESIVKIQGTVQDLLLKDGRRIVRLTPRTSGLDSSFAISAPVHVALSPLQSVCKGEIVTAVFVEPPEIKDYPTR
ncbi:ABC transporter ATP-binding protein [Alicyclobacillus sp. SO9]|uniref:ABC transporter ATP-binding protein n=1 Tax=Alicyclobacillus sp. SO9 TaxID=2665646 RepID=UPI0018E773B1|nr:ATP-binding cassette domain-containing protein [Alicyclobacillus sp. SO9]QQE79923.1 ATP-binding cassette domain-containing protein [Alicyclobacillus sp. SO9]